MPYVCVKQVEKHKTRHVRNKKITSTNLVYPEKVPANEVAESEDESHKAAFRAEQHHRQVTQ